MCNVKSTSAYFLSSRELWKTERESWLIWHLQQPRLAQSSFRETAMKPTDSSVQESIRWLSGLSDGSYGTEIESLTTKGIRVVDARRGFFICDFTVHNGVSVRIFSYLPLPSSIVFLSFFLHFLHKNPLCVYLMNLCCFSFKIIFLMNGLNEPIQAFNLSLIWISFNKWDKFWNFWSRK